MTAASVSSGGHDDGPARECVFCGSTAVNAWKSWNVTSEWTCDDCTPGDEDTTDEDWL